MKKTLLLVFIHGFQGGNDTFGNFPAHLRAITSTALPNIDVVTVTYPKFETRGDLRGCVSRLREWLQNTVIDIEVSNQAPSPTVDPSVHVILIGHSMGGIVAAEVVCLLASENLIGSSNISASVEQNNFMFPHVQGVMAFDTPFLGIAPGTVSYTAENHYNTASTAYGAITDVASVFGWGSKKDSRSSAGAASQAAAKTPTPAPLPTPASPGGDAAATPPWQRWGRYAMFAGAAGAMAAGGAAALYSQRDRFSAGWAWATSHLEFVGCLAQPEDLRKRVAALTQLRKERNLGCANFYTRLGRGAVAVPSEAPDSAAPQQFSISRHIVRSKVRTFCNLPRDVEDSNSSKATKQEEGLKWIEAVNDKVADETKAHISMFLPAENPAFYYMAHRARDLLITWVDKGWYSAAGDTSSRNTGPDDDSQSANRGPTDPDRVAVIE
ncbi:hypothetical protein LOZ61_005746 [Ophidiomyces ophidiicola]|uniref:Uncharacterized protein n=1 Tax=Ophidiomyces ophidiicola TaxID=1387563 RepID=A0ACB8URU2_9EURO|nr:hypothetical protein LOZ61_005746 [Ophidiomyces ophidiicola]KAI1923493.1 hypothetical protein LOZ60_005222 [Ophidiomyces ophidiicola]KAI2136105.1 hypothetical protein LOZ27_006296 [Ophidiomyces ophidiicola]KAI2192262.1 hypothetical protein LOZ20_004463 [Ophidiomyces ophidiicola]KAI2383756.1 hypothetical protein LOY88_005037 [Ophidiomyces ophidiicola]